MSLLRATLVPFLRASKQSPVITATATISLTLGLSLSAAVFSFVNALFMEPTWLAQPARVVWLNGTVESDPTSPLLRVSRLNYLDYAQAHDLFDSLATYRSIPLSLSVGDQPPRRLFGQIVSENYFAVLGVSARLGRTFSTTAPASGDSTAVVLSHSFWSRVLSADERVLGEVIRLNGHPFEVIGVTPEGFKGTKTLGYSDLWLPMASHEQVLTGANARWFNQRGAQVFEVLGRLRSGVSMLQAREAVRLKAEALRQRYPEDNQDLGATVIPYLEGAVNPNYRKALTFGLLLILIVVLLLLLIACANIGSLLLNRALARRQEMATRLALGAGRRQILAQLLVESAVLVTAGLLLGTLCFHWLRGWLWTLRPPYVADLVDLPPDWRVLAFALGLTLGTTLLCGLAPALMLLRSRTLASAIKPRADAAAVAGPARLIRSAIIVGQLGLCFVALVGSGLLLRSLGKLREIDPGFRHRDVLYVGIEVGSAGYNRDKGRAFQQAILDDLRRLPGIRAASLAELPLPNENHPTFGVELIDEPNPSELANLFVGINGVEPGYFDAVGLDLMEGRDFGLEDTADGPGRAIVNQRLAELLWPDGNAIGRRFRLDDVEVSVVGIARDAKYNSLTEATQPFAYRPLVQAYSPTFQLVLRGAGSTSNLLAGARGVVAGLDPTLPLGEVHTTGELLDTSMWSTRVGASLLTLIAAFSSLLAAIGVYSTQSATVQARRRDVALRLALGGTGPSVLGHVVRRSLLPILLGLVSGGLAAAWLAGRAESFLVGTSPREPLVFAVTTLGLGALAVLAVYLTARRLLSSSPMAILTGD